MSPSECSVYTAADLHDWPAATRGIAPPLRLAVFGDPVAHSVSPPMQNAALIAQGIDARYTRVHVRPSELTQALGRIAAAKFIGVNLTLPHKTAVLALLDTVDPYAASVGAVNTVRVEKDGSLRGFNTDGPGLARAVQAAFDPHFPDTRVLILGAAGGTGRTLTAQCLLMGCRGIVLVNRTPGKAQQLVAELDARYPGSFEQAGGNAVGSAHRPRDLWEHRPRGERLFGRTARRSFTDPGGGDPARAANLRRGLPLHRRGDRPADRREAAGARVAGGLSLLLYQGAYSFEHWFGVPAPLEAMELGLTSALRPAQPDAA